MVALRLLPLRRVFELVLQCPRAVGQNQVVTLGLVFLPGQHLVVVDIALDLVLLYFQVVPPVLLDWRVVHDLVPGPRPCPAVGLKDVAGIGPVLSLRTVSSSNSGVTKVDIVFDATKN